MSTEPASEKSPEVASVDNVPAGAMRLLLWNTGELRYGCRVEAGGWALSTRLDLRAVADRSELIPVLESMAEGDGWALFEGDLVGGVIGAQDVTHIAGTLFDAFVAAEAPRSPKRARR